MDEPAALAEWVLRIVTVSDLLELLGRGAQRPVAATPRRTLRHRTPGMEFA